MDVTERLKTAEAQRLIRRILAEGSVSYSDHAKAEMLKDKLSIPDCVNVLTAGVIEEPEFERGSWRYRVRTQRIYVVVAFRSETELSIVTAWRTGK